MSNNVVLFMDTETSGKANFNNTYKQNQPWIVQLAMILSDKDKIYSEISLLIQSNGRQVEQEAFAVHGIASDITEKHGITETTACYMFLELFANCDIISCHNIAFDRLFVAHMLYNNKFTNISETLFKKKSFCTMNSGTKICKLPGAYGKYKWPTLQELYNHLFGEIFSGAHDALTDVRATRKCYYEINKGVI